MKKSVKTQNKWMEALSGGFRDIKLVLEEGNYKLFLKQAAFIIVIFLAYRYASDMLAEKRSGIVTKVDAVHAQQNNEKEYLANKQKLLELEPRFPDVSAKNDWLLRQIVSVFKDSNLTPKIGSSQAEDTSNVGYTVAAVPVDVEASYGDFARLMADIENRDEFLRVTEFSLIKHNERLGANTIKMRINTVFLKEKIVPVMFKDALKTGETK